MNIYFKIVTFSVFLVIGTVSTLYFFVSRESESFYQERVLTSLTEQAREGTQNIDRFLHQRMADIKAAAQDPIIRNENSTPKQLVKRLREIQSLNELYYSMSFFNMERIRIADSKGLSIGKKHSFSKYWKEITESNQDVVLDISRSESVGEIVLHFASFVKDEKGKKVGLIVSRILIPRLYEVFKHEEVKGHSIYSSPNTLIDLVNQNGILLYSSHRPQSVLKDGYYNQTVYGTFLNTSSDYFEDEDMLYVKSEEKGYLGYKGQHWTLFVAVPKSTILAPVKEMNQNLLYVVLSVLMLSILGALVFSHYYASPVVKLSEAAREIGEGKLDTRIELRGHAKDELGMLAKSINSMASRLKIRVNELSDLNTQLNGMNSKLQDNLNKIHEQKEEILSQRDQIRLQNVAMEDAFKRLEVRNKQQTASINYAKRIQEAMLPHIDQLKQVFPNSFIFNRPRDIVSGDFYWFDKVTIQGRDLFILACADCTGHGVPGALMSMLGSNLLTNIVDYQKYIEPAYILQKLHKDIQRELHQDVRNDSNDGMEISLCTIDLETLEMEFTGAGRPMLVIRDGELIEFKGDRIPIGGLQHPRQKTVDQLQTYRMQLEEGDMMYLYSDGFKDQIGGQGNGRIFTTRRFKGVLQEIHEQSHRRQEDSLQVVYEGWKGEHHQTDDILVLGVKVERVNMQVNSPKEFTRLNIQNESVEV
ncbi:SpoIIE family protein phosphatase [Sediminitomix flava]|uniref:Serine phosphatase RsbU (Regulator of sigma subunit) n=1 Tax=Sediminitomix flava TaxID=379075 RepID=A0A315ZIG9_SEDFL|nr:SpoIIE family protein phosphatase [Sediminitomix flava]PWJ44618.1 serine phosphatase RsbU (regulator of sigma subunit) [Sediminitomix flava]